MTQFTASGAQPASTSPSMTLVGDVCIDENVIDGVHSLTWGSSTAYMSHYLRRNHHVVPTIVASYADDFLPFADGLVLAGPARSGATLRYENIVVDDRRVQYCHGAEENTPQPLCGDAKNAISTADVLVIAPLTPALPHDYVGEVLKLAKPDALTILMPQGYMRRFDENGLVSQGEFVSAGELIRFVDLVVFSDEDYPDAVAQAQAWHRESPSTSFVVTQNKHGATLVDSSGLRSIPTQPLAPGEQVSPVGAGDIFTAGLALAMMNGQPIEQAIATAHRSVVTVPAGVSGDA
ncbi:carbohydrate kinase family protein [Lysinibacter cavernae]|uniref:Sugar/nucleoside kinase (Ribokinase family) n=1 Tax=Lysinibacter cavernae TaxID=1640652 RepID=A0A7X5QZZ1_9MICO|nr:carbohydrate kinase family protein [Lysinibacter cavernae]NIH53130.1 sugar/nucleoside kinase (ribokinase family) [Lysinibacter cavernae]